MIFIQVCIPQDKKFLRRTIFCNFHGCDWAAKSLQFVKFNPDSLCKTQFVRHQLSPSMAAVCEKTSWSPRLLYVQACCAYVQVYAKSALIYKSIWINLTVSSKNISILSAENFKEEKQIYLMLHSVFYLIFSCFTLKRQWISPLCVHW